MNIQEWVVPAPFYSGHWNKTRNGVEQQNVPKVEGKAEGHAGPNYQLDTNTEVQLCAFPAPLQPGMSAY